MSKTSDKRVGDTTTIQLKERFTHWFTNEEIKLDEVTLKLINRTLKGRELSNLVLTLLHEHAHNKLASADKDDNKELKRIERLLKDIDRKISSGVIVNSEVDEQAASEEETLEVDETLDDEILKEQLGI